MLLKMVGPRGNLGFSYRLWFLINRLPYLRGSCPRAYCNCEHEIKKKDVSVENMAPAYNQEQVESGWYDWWESKGYFKAKDNKKTIPLLLPPPNVTGTLHLGHALTITIQDVFIRWLRMKGHSVHWIPGFDHGGIATQVVVEKYLQKMLNVTRYDLGKEEFLNKILNWKEEKERIIIQQMKQIAASVDWEKKYFTLDNSTSEAVREAFIALYNKGLIQRRTDHIKWSCFLKSGLSDIEINWKEVNEPTKLSIPGYDSNIEVGYIYMFAYKVYEDGVEGEEVIVSTTRPETMLGDTAIAVHPEDSRYQHLGGKFVWHPFRKCKIPIIFDEDVKPDMATGVLKVTPAHFPADLKIGKMHNLEVIEVFDENGLIRKEEYYLDFQNMHRFKAREKILNELHKLHLYKGKEAHAMVIPLCSRTGDIVEYLTKSHWFLKCGDMYEKVRTAIMSGDIDIEPEYLKDILLEWFKKNVDWNLSRQLWWGHQIPMYECTGKDTTLWVAAKSMDEALTKAAEKFHLSPEEIKIVQDEDVLDTWFSSAVLPLAISGWPHTNNSLYPLKLMETGSDIIFFWVARMLMLGLELTGQLPFDKVVLNGLICDNYGRKMSKSLGNVILPEYVIKGISLSEMQSHAKENLKLGILSPMEYKLSIEGQRKMFPSGIPNCGADALRLTLCSDKVKADQIKFNVELCTANRFFCNKMWQAVKYLGITQHDKTELSSRMDNYKFSIMDTWILSLLASTVEAADKGIGDFQYHFAVQSIKNFFIQRYCDIYLESTKLVLANDSAEDARRVISVMFNCLETSFRLLCPFTPFLTEELYHCLPRLNDFTPAESITIAEFPNPKEWEQYINPEVNKLMLTFMNILSTLRSTITSYKLSKQKLKLILSGPDMPEDLFCNELMRYLKKYGHLEDVSPASNEIPDVNVIVQNMNNYTMYLYHEHDRSALQEIFRPVLEKEWKLKESLDKLNSIVCQSNYVNETSAEIKRKNSATMSKLIEQLKKIEEVKVTIAKARS